MLNLLKNFELSDEERVCTILFDEVQLKPSFSYNDKFGSVDGKVDLGPQLDSKRLPTKCALSFMLNSPKRYRSPSSLDPHR